MAERLPIISERVDDIPLLLAQLEQMGVQPLLDEHFPTHGHWVGLSLGWVPRLWLTHILGRKRTIGCTMGHPGPSSGSTRCAAAPGSRSIPWTLATTVWRGLGGVECRRELGRGCRGVEPAVAAGL